MTAKSSHAQRKAADLLLLLFLWGCGESVERNIALLAEGGDAAEEAKMELNLAPGNSHCPAHRCLPDSFK